MVVFTYDAFTGTGTRTGTLTIAGLTVTVTQAGTNYIGPGAVITLVSAGLNAQGVAVDGSGNVYIADTDNNAIKEWSAATQQVTTLVSSGLNRPTAWRWTAPATSTSRIAATMARSRSGAPSTQQVTTLVSSGLNRPNGVAVDGSGNVYIVGYLQQRDQGVECLDAAGDHAVSSGRPDCLRAWRWTAPATFTS